MKKLRLPFLNGIGMRSGSRQRCLKNREAGKAGGCGDTVNGVHRAGQRDRGLMTGTPRRGRSRRGGRPPE